MNFETIKTLVSESNLPTIQKQVTLGLVQGCEELRADYLAAVHIIEYVERDKKVDQIFLSTDEVKIYTIQARQKWEIENPFHVVVYKDGKWRQCLEVCADLDTAILIYLQEKYLDSNSRFISFVQRMLMR